MLRIPREFELPGDEAVIYKEGELLIVEPARKRPGLTELLATMEPLVKTSRKSTIPPTDDINLLNGAEYRHLLGTNILSGVVRIRSLDIGTDNLGECLRVPALRLETRWRRTRANRNVSI